MAHGHGFTLEVGKSPNRLEMIVQIKDESLGKLLVANSTFFFSHGTLVFDDLLSAVTFASCLVWAVLNLWSMC